MTRFGVLGIGILAIVVLFAGCNAKSPYMIKIEAIRTTNALGIPVNLSLWAYDSRSEVTIRAFGSGKLDPKINGTEWVEFKDSKFVSLPAKSITGSGELFLQIKLNPNRLATPPDAIFELSLNPKDLLSSEYPELTERVPSIGDGEFELRVVIRRRPSG